MATKQKEEQVNKNFIVDDDFLSVMVKGIRDNVMNECQEILDKQGMKSAAKVQQALIETFESKLLDVIETCNARVLAVEKRYEETLNHLYSEFDQKLKMAVEDASEKNIVHLKTLVDSLHHTPPTINLTLPENALQVQIPPLVLPPEAIRIIVEQPAPQVHIPAKAIQVQFPDKAIQVDVHPPAAQVSLPKELIQVKMEVPARKTTTTKSIIYSEVTGRPETIREVVEES